MKNLTQPSGEFLLQPGLEDLHQESQRWISEIELWKIELVFFQNILDRYARSFQDVEDKKKIDQFQNFMIYYSGELLDETRKAVRQHEKFLASQLGSNAARMDEQSYRVNHMPLQEKVAGIRAQIAETKKALFEFLEPAL